MTGEYELLKKVLSTIEFKEGLNKDNIINDAFDILLRRKQTLLIIAAQNGYTKTVGVLLEAGADVNAKDVLNRTVLHYAALCGPKEIVEFLISKEADVNAKDVSNRTALHYAALYGHTKITEVLFGRGADFDIDEPLFLHNDAKNGRVDIVNALIKAGANVSAVDKYGKTPLDYAKNQDVAKALLDAGGRSSVEEHNNKAMIVKARNKAMIAGGVTTLLGTAIAVALFTTGIITAELIPIVIAVVAVTAAALVVGCATYALLKPSTKVDGAEKPSAALNGQQEAAL